MKKFTLLLFSFLCLTATINAQEAQVAPSGEELVQRMIEQGPQKSSDSDNFTNVERAILRAHFAGRSVQTVSSGQTYIPVGDNSYVSTGGTGIRISNGSAGSTTLDQNGQRNLLPITITHNTDQTIVSGEEIACASATSFRDNNIFRDFDLAADFGLVNGFDVTDVEVAIGPVLSPAGFPMTFNIYSFTGSFPADFPANATLQGTNTVTVTNADAESIISVPLAASVPAGEIMIYEIVIVDDGTDTNFMRFGCNSAAQTGVSWIQAPDCGANTPSDLSVLLGTNRAFIMNVIGDEPGGGGGGCGGTLANYTNSAADPLGGPPSQIFADFPDFDCAGADDFVVPGAGSATVCQVDITGSGAAIPADPSNLVRMTIYDDAAGVPGAVVHTEDFVGTDVDPDGDGIFTLTPTTPALTGGTLYWMSVQVVAEFGVSGQWFWTGATDANDGLYQWQNPGGGFATPCGSWGSGQVDCGVGGGAGPDLMMDIAFEEAGGGSCVSQTFDSTAVPFDIDGAGDVTADCVGAPNLIPTNVAPSGTIGTDSDIENVVIDIAHTWSGDLTISLRAPSGTELLLADQLSGNTDDAYNGTTFEDGGADITAATAPFGVGPYEPEGGTFAAAFAGEDINGDWNLVICDNAALDTGTVLQFTLNLCAPLPLDNNTCAGATPVACDDIIFGDTSDNTDDGGANTTPDEWYSFTGTGTPEVVTVSTCGAGTAYDTYLSVFDSCGGAIIDENDDSCGLSSQISFLSDGTSTYYIAVEGFSGSGAFELDVTCATPPANDQCDGAVAISCGDSILGTTINATDDTAVAPDCNTTTSAPGVWYVYEDTTGLVTDILLSTCSTNTDYDTKISVYTGDCSAPPLTCVDGNDDSPNCTNFQSEVEFQSDGNTTFYILVHGFAGDTGNFELTMTCVPVPPPNDMIANSIDVDEIGFPYTDPAVAMPAATTEAGSPAGCDNAGVIGVWYNFVPPLNGVATCSVTTPAGFTSVTFYDAPNETAVETDLTLIDYFDNQCVPQVDASVPVVAGQAYYVYVANTDAITDIVIDGTFFLGANDNVIDGFTYHPNPASTTVTMNSVEVIESVSVYNLLGQEVISQDINALNANINVANLATGAYIMKVSVNGQIGTYKIIKQ